MLPPNSTWRKCKNLINGEPMNPNICVKRWIYNEIRDLWHHGSRNRTYLWNHDSWVQAQFVDLNLLYTDPKRAIAQSQNYESKDLWIERATYIEISILDVRFTDKSPNLIGVQRSQKAKESLKNRRSMIHQMNSMIHWTADAETRKKIRTQIYEYKIR